MCLVCVRRPCVLWCGLWGPWFALRCHPLCTESVRLEGSRLLCLASAGGFLVTVSSVRAASTEKHQADSHA